jgi:hypothetical protein
MPGPAEWPATPERTGGHRATMPGCAAPWRKEGGPVPTEDAEKRRRRPTDEEPETPSEDPREPDHINEGTGKQFARGVGEEDDDEARSSE